MKSKLTVLMITKNADEMLDESLKSVEGLADEIVIVDAKSTDKTNAIAIKHNAKFFITSKNNLGLQRLLGLKKVKSEWVLSLDSDEIISDGLRREIIELLKSPNIYEDGFTIPYKNHFLNKPIKYGGENYKVMRLFKKSKVEIKPALVHEHFIVSGKIGHLNNKILHFSYRSILQTYKKFTNYALKGAEQKVMAGETTSVRKIILYPPHMFWARFIQDKGYKDGLFRVPLDIGFAYMEFIMYASMLFIKTRK